MILQCEWRHARKRWAENLGILKNTSVGYSTVGESSWLFTGGQSVEFYCRPVELGTRLGPVQLGVDFDHVESWSWVKTMVLRSWSLTMEFWRSLPTEILKTMRCAERLSFVSIEWFRIVSLSPRVEEPNSEVNKLINVRTWTAESPVYLSPPVFLHIYNVCDWYGYTTKAIKQRTLLTDLLILVLYLIM